MASKKRVCKVAVERLKERYCGTPTGSIVFHTSEGPCGIVRRGCPLGRGYSQEESIRDFIFRANQDDNTLKLTRSEVVVERFTDYTSK